MPSIKGRSSLYIENVPDINSEGMVMLQKPVVLSVPSALNLILPNA